MATINLLPWRAQLRVTRKRQFFLLLASCVALILIFLIILYVVFMRSIELQQQNNRYLQQQVAVAKRKLANIELLKKQTQQIITHIDTIQGWPRSRLVIVHLFEDSARVIPDGVYLALMERHGEVLNMSGQAASNASISQLMRAIHAAKCLSEPHLLEIKTHQQASLDSYHFQLQMHLGKCNAEIPMPIVEK